MERYRWNGETVEWIFFLAHFVCLFVYYILSGVHNAKAEDYNKETLPAVE